MYVNTSKNTSNHGGQDSIKKASNGPLRGDGLNEKMQVSISMNCCDFV